MAVARGAVAENSVSVQFLCMRGSKKFRRRRGPSGRGGPLRPPSPSLGLRVRGTSRGVRGTSAERSSLGDSEREAMMFGDEMG